MAKFLSVVNMCVILLVIQERCLARTNNTKAVSFSSTYIAFTSIGPVESQPRVTHSNSRLSELNDTIDNPLSSLNTTDNLLSELKHMTDNTKLIRLNNRTDNHLPKLNNMTDNPLSEYNNATDNLLSEPKHMTDNTKSIRLSNTSDNHLPELSMTDNPLSEYKNTTDNSLSELKNATENTIKVSEEPVRKTVVPSNVPQEEKEPKANEDIAKYDPFSVFNQNGISDDYVYRAGDNEEKSLNNNSDDRNHQYGETFERKFSNGIFSYGEKKGFESGKNLEFGVGYNKDSGARGVGISVGRGFVSGHGVGIAFGNGGKKSSVMSGKRVVRQIFPENEEIHVTDYNHYISSKSKRTYNEFNNAVSDEGETISKVAEAAAKGVKEHLGESERKSVTSNCDSFKLISLTGIVISIGTFIILSF